MEMLQWLAQLGVPVMRLSMNTAIPPVATLNIPLPKQLPEVVGRIYGLSIYADTVDIANNPLITSAQAQLLYLNFKDSQTDFFTPIRLDDLLFDFAGVPAPNGAKWYPCNLPGDFDLSTSGFINPSGIISAAAPAPALQIMLNFHYVDAETYKWMIQHDIVWQNAIESKYLKK